MTDRWGATSYTYDSKGRLRSVQRADCPAIVYDDDPANARTTISVGNHYRLELDYDFLGRLVKRTLQVLDPTTGRASTFPIRYEYRSSDGMVVRTLPNGIRTRWTYDPGGRLREILHIDAASLVLAEFTFDFGPKGRITSIHERSQRGKLLERFAYDHAGRLTQAARSDGRIYGYAYDALGNRLTATALTGKSQVADFDWAGRFTTLNGQPCGYDGAGNLVELPGEGATLRFRYDSDERLTEARNGARQVRYHYDGAGHLIARLSDEVETRFVCDPLSDLWRPLLILESNCKPTFVVWDGATPLMLLRDGNPEYLLHDHLGSVRVLVNGDGRTSQSFDYDPAGTPATDSAEKTGLHPRFAGLFWDADASLYLTLARAYAPHIGSFLQPDPAKRLPLDPAGETSLYQYCRGNPLCFVDRSGEAAEWYDDSEPWPLPSPLLSELDDKTFELALDLVLETAEELPGSWGKLFKYFNHARASHGNGSSARETAQYLKVHPGDPVGDMRALSFVLGILELAGFSLLGEVTTPLDTGILLSCATRSRVLQNRAERLVTFGGAVLPELEESSEGVGSHEGAFRYSGRGYSAHGGWRLSGSFQGWLGRNRDFEAWAESRVNDLRTAQGEVISGVFSRAEEWHERGGGLHNLYEPTSLTIIRRTHEIYRLRKGGGTSSPDEPASPSKFPLPRLLQVEIDAKPPYVRRRQEFPPDRRDPPPGPRRRDRPPLDGDPPDWDGDPEAGDPDGEDPRDRGGVAVASPVGGVYLGGIVGALEGFGALKGVRLAPNGDLVLLAAAGGDVETPPLRLEDVVTVFRSVYLDGQGPTVTIDPVSQGSKSSPMAIRHSKATEGTYVGWILYQADRLMKGYTLGVDNLTEREVVSRVPGHREVLDAVFFGGDPEKRQKGGTWERFWIVPAAVRRVEGPRRELTLVDVPLKVNTQSMRWRRGKLVDDLAAESSPGARAFTAWFTSSYDLIAAEQTLMPPPESGLSQPVPVFVELQRIALITAIAEALRDQGVPIPFWMRDYEVATVPFEKTTPGLQVSRERGTLTTRIFGGVDLSSGGHAAETLSISTDTASLPPHQREDAAQRTRSAAALEESLTSRPALVGAPPFRIDRFAVGEEELCAVALPGAATLATGALDLREVDLAVPLPGRRTLELIRHHNSFFSPTGHWGQGWTLDLPRLVETRVSIQRERDSVRYATARELVTPLNSLYTRFYELRLVPELGNSRLQVPDRDDGMFYGLANDRPMFLGRVETLLLLLKDGGRWHFNQQGELVATQEGGLVTLYERDSDRRVLRMVALLGEVKEAAITLHYGRHGRLASAEAIASGTRGRPTKARVDYEYDSSGRLAWIGNSAGRVGYRYEGPWIEAITWQDRDVRSRPSGEEVVLRTFRYNRQGQLLEETFGSRTTRHATLSGPAALTVTRTTDEDDGRGQSTFFDSRLRPIESTAADGTRIQWNHTQEGGVEIEVTGPDRLTARLVHSPANRRWTLIGAEGASLVAEYDSAGRPVALTENGKTLFEQRWRTDGQIASVESGPRAVTFQYDDLGLLSSAIEHAPGEHGTFQHWQATTYDRHGRPVGLSNHEGLNAALAYDDQGDLVSLSWKTTRGEVGFKLHRDRHGRLQTFESPWGTSVYEFDGESELRRVATTCGKRKAWIELEGGKVRRRVDFDGGETVYSYFREGPHARLPQEVVASDGLTFRYTYDERARFTRVRVGTDRVVEVAYDEVGRPVAYSWASTLC